MNPKDTPESKTQKTNINSNKKKTDKIQGSIKKIEPSALKKNEFALILFGALLLTAIIFFLFFRSSDTNTKIVETVTSSSSSADLEKRVEALENAFEIIKKDRGAYGSGTQGAAGIGHVKERVSNLETAFSAKFASLIKRMDKIEKSISGFKKKSVADATSKPASSVKKEQKTSLSHTIKKGETLYSISKKYNTTVTSIQKLNKMAADAKLYPGDTILVK